MILRWLTVYGVAVVFLNLLLEQLGLPLPAYPALVVTGALSVDGRYGALSLLGAAVAACVVADLAWYAAGRRWGQRVLRTVCRVSISPDSCVRQTESLYARWGVASLLVAKFVPGFATVATALAGRMRVPLATFVAFDAVGATLYGGAGIALGRAFHGAVDEVLAVFESMGRIGGVLVLAALALFIAGKWWQRQRLIRELRMARITVPELERMLDDGETPVIIDVRPADHRAADGTIPGAIAWAFEGEAPDVERDVEVVVYCACPNEISAARVAQRLRAAGFTRVRPLLGGIDAWVAAGRPVQRPG
jgi:membrane protein DedA with SNARE-associated domain/rhodanese-related sulfurtransferase